MLNNFKTQYIIWDRANKHFYEKIELSSSDEQGRRIVVQILDNGKEIDLTGYLLNLYWETSNKQNNGLDNFTALDIKKGIFELYATTGMLSNVGNLYGLLYTVDVEGKAITSLELDIKVHRGIDTQAVESQNSFTALTDALGRVVSYETDELLRQEQERNRVAAENDRKEAELLREQAEAQRKANFQSNQQSRENTFNQSQQSRESTFNQSQQSRETSFENEQSTRNTRYEQAESNRNSQYNTAESNREESYASAEAGRNNQYATRITDLENMTDSLISEVGTTSTGHYVKRADGTMECTQTFSIGGSPSADGNLYYIYADPRNWTFPVPFVEAPTLSYSTWDYGYFMTTGSVRPDRALNIIGYRAGSGSVSVRELKVTAHGYWKKDSSGGAIVEKFEPYPKYWKSHLSGKINRVLSLQSENLDTHSFGFITDMHLPTNEKHSFGLMKDVVEKTNMHTFINGGDTVTNNSGTTKENAEQQIRDMIQGFNPIKDKMMNTMANHDDNTLPQKWSEALKEPDLYSELFRYMGNNSIYGETGKYHYRDNHFHKVRYIVLDSIDIPYIKSGTNLVYRGQHDYAFRQKQLDWFANVALDVPTADWAVVVVSHVPPYESGVTGFDRAISNADLARGILKAFKDKTTYSKSSASGVRSAFRASVSVDFRNKGGDVICWLSGHVHFDNIVTMPEGIKLITTICDTNRNWESTDVRRVAGTLTEQAFDVVTVNRSDKRIYLTRVGAGSDRTTTY